MKLKDIKPGQLFRLSVGNVGYLMTDRRIVQSDGVPTFICYASDGEEAQFRESNYTPSDFKLYEWPTKVVEDEKPKEPGYYWATAAGDVPQDKVGYRGVVLVKNDGGVAVPWATSLLSEDDFEDWSERLEDPND